MKFGMEAIALNIVYCKLVGKVGILVLPSTSSLYV
jgi:hypothetical protein